MNVIGGDERCAAGHGKIGEVLEPPAIVAVVEVRGAEIDRAGGAFTDAAQTFREGCAG